MPDVFVITHRASIILAAARNNVPAVYTLSAFAEEGGRGPRRLAHVRLGAFEQKIGAGNQADDAVCHDIRAQAAVEFPVPKPTGCARPKSQGANQGMTSKKPTQRQDFKTGEFIVYPAHGVGQIVAIEEQEVAGSTLELFVINFVKDKMTLRVPTAKISAVGMRKLAEQPIVRSALWIAASRPKRFWPRCGKPIHRFITWSARPRGG
jgi:hypothetical protein